MNSDAVCKYMLITCFVVATARLVGIMMQCTKLLRYYDFYYYYLFKRK